MIINPKTYNIAREGMYCICGKINFYENGYGDFEYCPYCGIGLNWHDKHKLKIAEIKATNEMIEIIRDFEDNYTKSSKFELNNGDILIVEPHPTYALLISENGLFIVKEEG